MDKRSQPGEPGVESSDRSSSDNTASDKTEGAAELLALVGGRVRLLRSRRGMTRRDLSSRASISERYLGQLEKGLANITVGLLQRIAITLDAPLSAVLPLENAPGEIPPPLFDLLAGMSENQQAEAYRMLLRDLKSSTSSAKGLALVGMRGAGKTTLGRQLAEHRQLPFIRISDVILELAGMAIGELLEMTGQDAYRRLEFEALEHIVANHGTVVVEAGGGLVSETRNYNLLLKYFHTIWVQASPEEHMQRVTDQGDMRPMAGNSRAMDDLRAILREREPFYRQADQMLDTRNRTVEDCYTELDRIAACALGRQTEAFPGARPVNP